MSNSKPKFEFFFDCSSPWSYLAFVGVQPICKELGIDILWRPVLVGGVFNTVNPELYSHRANPNPVRQKYVSKDLADWCHHYDIKIGMPEVFPVNSVKAMRGALVAQEQNKLVAYGTRVFQTYWEYLEDISQDEVLSSIVNELAIDSQVFFEKINHQSYKDNLRFNTDELIRRGGFGVPTMYINDDDMYFGNDRLMLVRKRLQQLL